ncbi:MAG: CoA transferase [Pseudomonadota bacterium]
MNAAALDKLRILDLTDERAIYGAKLLGDLGADVVRPEPVQGDPLRGRGPFKKSDHPGRPDVSLYYAFFASSRRHFQIDLERVDGQELFNRLVQACDVIVACQGGFGVDLLDFDELRTVNPELVIVDVTSFGRQGPWKDYAAPDFVAGALAGAVATTGDVDTPPLKAFGDLNFMVSGAYAGIAALSAIRAARTFGGGDQVSVNVHECIASCLEQVLMFYWYAEVMMRPEGKVLPRRGSTHWSDAFTVMNGQDGSIMVTPTPDWDKQLAWLIEEDAHEDLIDPKYLEPENLRLRIERTMELLTGWVSTKEVEPLFFDAQDRHMPYGWVQPLSRIGENPQLQAREWFVDYNLQGEDSKGPGAPYQFSRTPWSVHAGVEDPSGIPADPQTVLADLGWEGSA